MLKSRVLKFCTMLSNYENKHKPYKRSINLNSTFESILISIQNIMLLHFKITTINGFVVTTFIHDFFVLFNFVIQSSTETTSLLNLHLNVKSISILLVIVTQLTMIKFY